ncbi:MAG: hypothetical protein U1F68_13115 [Gammaproteobacteria bacterium]
MKNLCVALQYLVVIGLWRSERVISTPQASSARPSPGKYLLLNFLDGVTGFLDAKALRDGAGSDRLISLIQPGVAINEPSHD